MPMIDVYAPAGTFRRAVKERIWVLLTEAPDRAEKSFTTSVGIALMTLTFPSLK